MTDQRTYKIIGAAMEVHRELGSGFLEAVYHEALEREFNYQKIPFKSKPQVGIEYKREPLEKKYEPDFICYDVVIVEIKAMNKLTSNEHAQIINYLKAAKFKVGLLINFGSKSLEHKRFFNNFYNLEK